MKNPTLYNHNAVREAQLEQNLDARINAPAAEPLQAPALPAHLRVRTHQELLPISAASDDELLRRMRVCADAGDCEETDAIFDACEAEFDRRHPEALAAERKALLAIAHKHATAPVRKHAAPQGAPYKRGQHYRPGDRVTHNGRTYVCLANHASVRADAEPGKSSRYWRAV